MKKQMWLRFSGFAMALTVSILWLLFVVDIWQNGLAIQLPIEVAYIYLKGNAAYTVSAGLPAVAFCLICVIPRTLVCIFSQSTRWKPWYTGTASLLLAAQTVCMLPASRWFASFAKRILGYQAGTIMKKMMACYVHALVPALAICVLCWLICIFVNLSRSPDQIPNIARKNGLYFLCNITIVFLVTVASLLILNILTSFGIVNKGYIHSFCYHNAHNVSPARISVLWAPVVEEIAFRGLICKGLDKYGRKWPAILISAIFFGIWHRNMTQFAYTVVWGIIFGYIFLSTRTVFWPMLMHAASNLLVILAYSDSSSAVFGAWPRLVAFQKWLGKLPVVSSALLLIAISVAVVILLRCYRSRNESIQVETI